MKLNKSQRLALSYASPKIGKTNLANEAVIENSMLEPHESGVDNTYTSQSLELAAIPYSANQSVDSLLWNGNFCPISIFGINKYLDSNAKNIICLLYRMTIFIR